MAEVSRLEVRLDGRAARVEADAVKRRLSALGREGTKLTGTTTAVSAGLTRQSVATRKLSASNAGAVVSTTSLTRSMKGLLVATAGFAGLAVGGGALGVATKNAAQFSVALAEVNTLIDESFGSIEALGAATNRFARSFGTSTEQQAKALYQIISAGATDAAAAIELLDVVNRLAKGGVTETATAADGLTTALNAYGLAATEALDVSDQFFIAVKAGKTTVGELSSSIGQIAPIAAQLGLNLDEVLSTLAGLTKSGINTRRSVTGLRAIIVSILKPTDDQKNLARELGIEWNGAALKAKGFVGIIREMVQATGGNQEQMTRLLATTEALTPAFAIAGQAGDDINATLELMAKRAGATDDAVGKIAASLGDRLKVAGAGIAATFEDIGTSILERLVPAIEFLNENLKVTLAVLGAIAVAMLAAFSPAIIAGIARVGLLLAALVPLALANPIGAIVVGVVAAGVALVALSNALEDTNSEMETFNNILDGNASALTTWKNVATSAFSSVFDSARDGLADVIFDLKDATQKVGRFFSEDFFARGGFIPDGVVKNLAESFTNLGRDIFIRTNFVEVSKFAQQRAFADAQRATAANTNAFRVAQGASQSTRPRLERQDDGSFTSITGSPAIGRSQENRGTSGALDTFTDSQRERINAQLDTVEIQQRIAGFQRNGAPQIRGRHNALALPNTELRNAFDTQRDNRGGDQDEISSLRRQIRDAENNQFLGDDDRSEAITRYNAAITKIQNPLAEYNTKIMEQIRLSKIQDPALRQVESALSSQIRTAEAKGIPVSQKQIEIWRTMFTELARINGEFENKGPLAEYRRSLSDLGDAFENLAITGIRSASDALADFVLNGKLDLASLGDVLRNIAQQIVSLAIQRAVISPIVGSFGFADGGVFGKGGVTAFANGGVVNSPTVFPFANGTGLMGEAGPEAIIPLKRGANGKLGVENFGSGGGGTTVVSNVSVNIEGNVDTPERADEIGRNIDRYVNTAVEKAFTKARKSGGAAR